MASDFMYCVYGIDVETNVSVITFDFRTPRDYEREIEYFLKQAVVQAVSSYEVYQQGNDEAVFVVSAQDHMDAIVALTTFLNKEYHSYGGSMTINTF